MAEPNTRDDAAGNVAMIGNFILRNLADQGMTVDDILDPNQEAQFHAVRKAVRSVEVLVDMFPSLTAAVGEAREPLDDLVGDFGKVNDQIIALRLEEAQSWDTSERVDALRKAYAKAVKTAQQFVSSDELDNYARPLELAERRHRLK
jgi:hypothetical protein